MTAQVFQEHGFQPVETGVDHLVLERKASEMDNLTYGGWAGDTPLWVRVKLSVMTVVERTCRLECKAYFVEDKGSVIEKEVPVKRLHRGDYQKFLEEVAGRLTPKTPVS